MTNYIPIVGFLFAIAVNSLSASRSLSKADATLNEFYDNLLQREYAGPISFPDHQVERKAQRSPSLRLRFGRSDTSMFTPLTGAGAPADGGLEKRWFGDVNQKPIRSPSLRLRFGKRGDDGIVRLQSFDDDFDDYRDRLFDRQQRIPSGRLRWGRSLPFNELQINNQEGRNNDNDLSTIGNESLQALLNALRELNDNNELSTSQEFSREIRKPTQLRLRWGRSTGNLQPSRSTQTQMNDANNMIFHDSIHDPSSASSSSLSSLTSTNENERSLSPTKLV